MFIYVLKNDFYLTCNFHMEIIIGQPDRVHLGHSEIIFKNTKSRCLYSIFIVWTPLPFTSSVLYYYVIHRNCFGVIECF